MAELELSLLQRQCQRQRIPDREAMTHAVTAWAERRNGQTKRIDWPLTTAGARIKQDFPYALWIQVKRSAALEPVG
jgi:hypothetical protein